MLKNTVVVVFISLVALAISGKLPPFITPCARGDSACALASAQKAFPELSKGYKPLKIKSLNPFNFDKLDLSSGKNLKVELLNGKALVDNISIDETNLDMDANKFSFKVHFNVQMTSDYDVSGQLLILPIVGIGKCRIEFDNMVVEYEAKLKVVDRKSTQYIEMVSDEMLIKMDAMRVQFDNLFNGDKALGDNVNTFINENWADVEREFHGGIVKLGTELIRSGFRPIMEHVPMDEIIL